jgi:uncharacterized protein (DUF1800 family)
MKSKIKHTFFGCTFLLLSIFLFSFYVNPISKIALDYKFPYQSAGLTGEQAAEHLLSRFTFGVRPNDIEVLTKLGLEQWFEKQLEGGLEDVNLQKRLEEYDALKMSNTQILANFPRAPTVKNMALRDGFITEDDIKNKSKRDLKVLYDSYRISKGLRPEFELYRQLISQKIIRATYSNNQLHEVLTDFWFNHFNVSTTKNTCAPFILVYERDAIRSNLTGRFENILLATAKSPAMLTYLDNFSSTGIDEEMESDKMKKGIVKENKKNKGLNENFAREVMELHTMGVDGGYSQQDVTEAARILTGWTIYPLSEHGSYSKNTKLIDKIGDEKFLQKGFFHDGDFLFTMNFHDNHPKTVMGKAYDMGGYQEGLELMKDLAKNVSTAKFICKKIATRFVNDHPTQTLVDKMAKKYITTNGDIKSVLIEMVCDKEFWSKEALRGKTKSPFEYAISSLRSLQADITMPFQVNNWVKKMGQKLYAYQAPTGFPDKAEYWINTGSLLNRMNFGLALAGKKIKGIKFDLASLNNYHEPENTEDALNKYAKLILPERNLEGTLKRLTPLINNPNMAEKINDAADKNVAISSNEEDEMIETNEMMNMDEDKKETKNEKRNEAMKNNFGDNSMLAQVVGIIIGSPEFQRR